jgi:hypothetical protein
MEFIALIHGDEASWEAMPDDERQAVYQRYMQFSKKPQVVGGAELQETETATTVRVRDGEQLVTDGPYAEAASSSSRPSRSTRPAGSPRRSPPPSTARSRCVPSTCERRAEMRYAMLIYNDPEPWYELSEEEAAKRTEESLPKWYAFFEELAQADPNMRGKELDDPRTAKTVRVRDGELLVTDGPFAETKEQIGGFFDTNLSDLDTAIAYAAKIPAAEYGSIEVRPVVERE